MTLNLPKKPISLPILHSSKCCWAVAMFWTSASIQIYQHDHWQEMSSWLCCRHHLGPFSFIMHDEISRKGCCDIWMHKVLHCSTGYLVMKHDNVSPYQFLRSTAVLTLGFAYPPLSFIQCTMADFVLTDTPLSTRDTPTWISGQAVMQKSIHLSTRGQIWNIAHWHLQFLSFPLHLKASF